MNVLLVEDETRVADFVSRGLKVEGFATTVAHSAEDAEELLRDNTYDAILLDVMLPGMDGVEFCSQLRAKENFTPVMILSALDDTDQRVAGLKNGADDYLPKPFEFEELIARLEALHRRATTHAGAATTAEEDRQKLVFDHVEIDRVSMRVFASGQEVEVTEKERDILILLATNKNRALSREKILNSVWGAHADPLTNVVDVYIGRLRKKLGLGRNQLVTLRGVGFRLDCLETGKS